MLVKVKVFPNSKKQEVIRKTEDSFEVRVKEKPIENKANKSAIELLSLFLKIPKGKIRLIKGSKQKNKIFRIN